MKRAIIGSFALSLAAGVAYAQDTTTTPAGGASQGASPSLAFSTVDTNNDGRVSSAEAQSHSALRSEFATLDANSDGYLSEAEFGKMKSGSGASGSGSRSGAPGASGAPGSSSSPGSSSGSGAGSTSPNSGSSGAGGASSGGMDSSSSPNSDADAE